MDRESEILLGQGRCIRELLLVVFLYKTTERRERERENVCTPLDESKDTHRQSLRAILEKDK
jgi:hypothetical protein